MILLSGFAKGKKKKEKGKEKRKEEKRGEEKERAESFFKERSQRSKASSISAVYTDPAIYGNVSIARHDSMRRTNVYT